MMFSLLHLIALEGQWHGAAAVALVLTGVFIFIGLIYILLASNFGWAQGYLITMTSLSAFSIILAGVWLIGIPGTIPGTGPRGTEPYWVVFKPDSEQAQEFSKDIQQFPQSGTDGNGHWRRPASDELYPGNISPLGEIDNVKHVLEPTLAAYFQKQKTGSADPLQYDFRLDDGTPLSKLTPDQAALPAARVFFKGSGDVQKIDPQTKAVLATYHVSDPASRLLIGIDLPPKRDTTSDPKCVASNSCPIVHPAIRVFGYRNKGRVFQAALEWLVVSIILFGAHVAGLSRFEKRQNRRIEELASGSAPPRQPVGV